MNEAEFEAERTALLRKARARHVAEAWDAYRGAQKRRPQPPADPVATHPEPRPVAPAGAGEGVG